MSNELIEDAGYPVGELETLLEASEAQFEANVEKHGAGKNWLDYEDEARWHVWKACDELFQARDHVHDGDHEGAVPHFGDAMNHMMFAMEIARNA